MLVARLGTAEFFLEDAAAGTVLQGILRGAWRQNPPGVYPVLREDAAFQLSGEGVHDVLAQVCNVHFAAFSLDSRPVIMTLMIGVAVLVVPQESTPRGGIGSGAIQPSVPRSEKIWSRSSLSAGEAYEKRLSHHAADPEHR